jgi:peptide subunit release factor 1 (eRF1)
MIARAEIDRLLEYRPAPDRSVLSVYLDVDQSKAANLNREFEAALKTRLRGIETSLEGAERERFATAAERVLRFAASYHPRARTLVIFSEGTGLFWTGELRATLPTEVRFEPAAWVRPLVEVFDEYERYGVIMVDKERARVFTVFLGEVEEERDAFAAAEVRHKKASGTDHLRSQMNFQRQDEMHVRQHLKRVADLMDELARHYAFDRLVLSGPVTATSELHRLLPKRLRGRVVGTLRLPPDAPADDVLRETMALEQAVEREAEKAYVEQLLTAAGKGNGGTIGSAATLSALQEGRVLRLVYADGFSARGSECVSCRAVFAGGQSACGYCGGELRPVGDLVQRAIERAAETGGRIELVRGEAAARLLEAGGIGAILRF